MILIWMQSVSKHCFLRMVSKSNSDAVVADLNALVPLGWWGYRCLEQSEEYLPNRSSTMTSIEIETSR